MNQIFPPVEHADEEGLLAIGGKLTPELILAAYKEGIFPWYSKGEPVLWWSPDPRFVLYTNELHISRSMHKVFRQSTFEFRMDTSFNEVIHCCKNSNRSEQNGTWITDEMEDVYKTLNDQGYGFSAEAWKDGELAGGMYGIKIGRMYYGESMFSKSANASKFALISFIQFLNKNNIPLLDCQVYSSHVESLGARSIDRKLFVEIVKELTSAPADLSF